MNSAGISRYLYKFADTAGIAKVTMKEVLREMMPYYVPLLVTLALITYIPGVTTWIPRLAVGGP